MKREQLTELIRGAVSGEGYDFHTGETHLAGGTIRAYPAAWLEPPVVIEHTGRNEGETTWRVSLHFMALPVENVSGETIWERLEADALAVTRRLADSQAVCSVDKTACIPARRSLTVHGEISVALTFDVTTWYHF